MKKPHKTRKGFTLVELLTVIAIIGILAAILIPTVGRVMDMANRSAGQSDMRSIAQIYFAWSVDSTRPRTMRVDNFNQWAMTLADEADLNDAAVYILSFDPATYSASGAFPTLVASLDSDGGDPTINSDFDTFPKSIAVINGMSPRAPSSTSPIAFTYGLTTQGRWIDNSPYEGDGGHIGYIDGHVEWYRDLGDGQEGMLVEWGRGGERTFNMMEAIDSANATIYYYRTNAGTGLATDN